MNHIQQRSKEEGEIICKWLESRLIRNNKNVLICTTGGTGSGKSYSNHRIAELWYKYHFNEEYQVDRYTCFSIKEIMERLTDKVKPLRRGDILIFEEAGTQLGSLDFQNKVQKLFTYVLQSFRSMNIAILFNLPVLSMLNKSARLLLHAHFMTDGINTETNQVRIKPLFQQLNQQSGKVYLKFLRINVKGVNTPCKRLMFNLPSEKIIHDYEIKKKRFVSDLNESFIMELRKKQDEIDMKLERPKLTDIQQFVYDKLKEGLSQKEIAKLRGCVPSVISEMVKFIEKKGYSVEKRPIFLAKSARLGDNPPSQA